MQNLIFKSGPNTMPNPQIFKTLTKNPIATQVKSKHLPPSTWTCDSVNKLTTWSLKRKEFKVHQAPKKTIVYSLNVLKSGSKTNNRHSMGSPWRRMKKIKKKEKTLHKGSKSDLGVLFGPFHASAYGWVNEAYSQVPFMFIKSVIKLNISLIEK